MSDEGFTISTVDGIAVSKDPAVAGYPIYEIPTGRIAPKNNCDTYWGSHGCNLPHGHEGPCKCDCADDPKWQGVGNVGGPPYYGEKTTFYGDDIPEATRLAAKEEA